MADSETIVTKFTADTAELEAAVKGRLKPIMDEYVKQTGQADKSTEDLENTIGSLSAKLEVNAAAHKRVSEQQKGATKGIGEMGTALKDTESLLQSDIQLVKQLIAEASKTPQGAAALAKDLNAAQKAALGALVTMGSLTKEEAKIAEDAQKIISAQGKMPVEVQKTAAAYVSLRTQIQNARNNLDQLVESGTATDQEIKAAAQSAGDLQKRFEQANATIQAFNPDKKFQALTGVIQNVAGGFTAVQGLIALTGGNTDQLAKSLLRVQAALAVTQGLQSLFGGLKDNLKLLKLLFTSSASAARTLAGAEVLAAEGAVAQGAATGGLTGFLNGAKLAAQRLYATLIANPFIAVAAALGLIIAGIIAYNSETKAAVETSDELIARLDRLAQREKFTIDRRAQENLIQSERLFLEDKAAALKLNTEAERKAALATAEANRKRRDDGIEQVSIEKEIAAQKALQAKLEEERSKKRREFTGQDKGLRAGAIGTRDPNKEEQAELTALTKRIQEQRDVVLKLEADLNTARGKSQNEVVAGQLDAEEARVNAVRGGADKVVKVSEDEAAKRIALQRQVADILAQGENEIFLASLTEREKATALLAQDFDKRVSDITTSFDRLRELAGGDTSKLTEIDRQEGDALNELILQQQAEALRIRIQFDEKDSAEARKHADELLAIQEKLAKEQQRMAEEEARRLEDNLSNIESFVERSIALFARRNDAEQQARDERIAAINEDFAAQLSANEQFDQSEQNRTRKRDAILAEQAAAVAAERERLAGEEKTAREARSKELIAFLLDELEKIILINAVKIESSLIAAGALTGPIGAAAGLAQGVAFALLIKALFAGVKAAVGAAYEGEPYVRGKQTWSGKDGHLRRVHTGERIVTTKDNAHHWDMLEAMRKGNLDRFIHTNYVLPELDKRGALPNGLTTAATLTRDPVQIVNSYVSTDTGQRVERSVMLAKYHDRNIVEAQARQTKEQRKTNALLEMMLAQAGTKRHSRTWAD